MKTILFGLVSLAFLGGCGIQTATEDTRDLVKTSNGVQENILAGIERTLESTHELKSLTALQNMTAPENTVFLDPPVQMMPFAEIFVETTSEINLTKASYVLLSTAMLPVQNPTPEQTRQQEVAFAAFRAVSGLMPDAKMQTILNNEVIRGGRYQNTAVMMVAARYVFIRDVLINTILDGKGKLNVGSLKEVAKRFASLKALAALPFAPKAPLEVPATYKDKLGLDSVEKLKLLGEKAIDSFKEDLSPETFAANQALLDVFVVQ